MKRSSFSVAFKSEAVHEDEDTSTIFDYCNRHIYNSAEESRMSKKRKTIIAELSELVAKVINHHVMLFKEQFNLTRSLFDLQNGPLDPSPLITRFRLVEFGSTMLGVETSTSDLDLLVTTFDCLLDRNKFFNEIEV